MATDLRNHCLLHRVSHSPSVRPGTDVGAVGRPLDNGCAYIVDRDGQLVPDGLPGELWLGGDTVGRGYLHEPGLTAAAFPRRRRYCGRPRPHPPAIRHWLPDGELGSLDA
jgi:non-ribosomal peptide synthetase component F